MSGAEEPELLQKDQISVCCLLVTPFCGEIMNVRELWGLLLLCTCGPKKRLSSPREQTAGSGGCAGRGCPSLTQHFSGVGCDGNEGTGQVASRWADAGQAPLHRLSPRTMLNVLLLCCGLLQGIQAVLDLRSADLSCGHLQKASGGLEGADRARHAGQQRGAKEVSAGPAGECRGRLLFTDPHRLLDGKPTAPELSWGSP